MEGLNEVSTRWMSAMNSLRREAARASEAGEAASLGEYVVWRFSMSQERACGCGAVDWCVDIANVVVMDGLDLSCARVMMVARWENLGCFWN